MKKREEIAKKDTWKLQDMLPSDDAWESLYQEILQKLPQYQDMKGTLSDSALRLYQCLNFEDEMSLKLELLYVYAKQKSDQDTREHKYQDFAARAQSLSYQLAEASAFIEPEILAIEEKRLKEFMEDDCGIAHFKRFMELLLAKKPHVRSQELEELLAQSYEATQNASNIYRMFNNADLKFPVITDASGEETAITHSNFIALLESSDRRVRRDAFTGLYQVYQQFQNTIAAVFFANVKQAVFYARARHDTSARAGFLRENEIPESVYDNLIQTVRQNLPKLHRYVAVRKKALKLSELHMYDLYTPMVSGQSEKISFDQAKEMVKEGLRPLGEEYGRVLEEGFQNRWIDVYENEGKRSGAYSWGAYGVHPYVLLNYNETLDYVFTLAHEMGHALHSYYSDKNQPYTYAGYKIFVAEVASTCNEALLIRHLLNKTSNPAKRAYLINHFLDSFRTTLFRQTMFAEFEAIAYQTTERGESLTANVLCDLYGQLNQDYFGDEMVIDEEIRYEWERIPHFIDSPFYVYQYATGFSAAIAISSRLLSGDQEALEGYMKFLKGGNSMPPIELLKLCGVDMSKPEPVEEALMVFQELLGEFEELTAGI